MANKSATAHAFKYTRPMVCFRCSDGRLDSLRDKLSLFQLHCERPSRSLTASFDRGMKAEMSLHEKDDTSHITFSYYNFQLVSMEI